MYSVIALNCPHCGASVSIEWEKCKYCDSPIMITSFDSIYSLTADEIQKYIKQYQKIDKNNSARSPSFAIGMCYLSLEMYEKALEKFEDVILNDFDNADAYFYASICCLEGKNPFLVNRKKINSAEKYLNAAITVERRSVFLYFYAYIKYNFYERKSLYTNPTHIDLLKEATSMGISESDKRLLKFILKESVCLTELESSIDLSLSDESDFRNIQSQDE